MTLQKHLRGFRATAALMICTALALTPAAADAKTTKKSSAKKHVAALKEARGTKPATKVAASKPAASNNGLGNTLGVSATNQLAAMTTAINAAPSFFAGRSTGCKSVTPMLASQGGSIMAGNFRDSDGYCYVWLNMQQSEMLSGSEICKTTLHEMGHLSGLQHSGDVTDVMFAPFQADPIPAPCLVQPASAAGAAKVKAKSSSAAVCPPGATNADYCQSAVVKKKRATRSRAKLRRS